MEKEGDGTRKGDQKLNWAQNKTLNESPINGVEVRYFESFKKNEYRYVGQMELVGDAYQEKQPDVDILSIQDFLTQLEV